MSDPLIDPPRRRSFATSDQLEARELMDEVYGDSRLRVRGGSGDRWDVSITELTAGHLSLSEARLPSELTFRGARQEVVLVNTVLDGTVEIENAGVVDRYVPGEVFVGLRPDVELGARTRELRVSALSIPAGVVAEVAGGLRGGGSIGGLLGVSTRADAEGAAQWKRIARFAGELITADPQRAAGPLVTGRLERLAAASALSFVVGALRAEPTRQERRDAHPATLRRAIAFIEANPAADITIADVGRAAYATPRTVQLAFRRHLDTTPTAYLRKVRLENAHRELSDAAPTDGVTVARVALGWGFASPSRFAAYYRSAYGRSPSKTLAG